MATKTVGTIKLEQRKIASLIPFARNSRTHSDAQIEQLAASIREFGFTNPVLVDERGGGNCRPRAAVSGKAARHD